MSTRSRLVAGFSATAVGPLITAMVQIVSVPSFLSAWGPQLYGEWLILNAIPSYLSITDVGFGSVAGNDMAIRIARSDREGAVQTFQSTWLLVTAISLLVGIVACGVIFAAPAGAFSALPSFTPSQARGVLALLSIYAVATLHASILLSGFRAAGQYAAGVSALNVVRLAENAGMLVLLLWLHSTPLQIALVAAAVRVVGTLFVYGLLLQRVPWIRIGVDQVSRQRLKELTRPAAAFMAFPAGNAISIQGMTMVIGFLLGPVAIATFTPMRTLSRFAYQVVDSIKNAVWPEFSAAYGAQNWRLARTLHRSCCQIALWFAVVASGALAVMGPAIFRIWTKHRVEMDAPCFWVLLSVVVASAMWNTSSAVSIAANRHETLALQYLIGAIVSLLLAYVLITPFHLVGAAVALLASDIWMGCFVLRGSNALLQDDMNDFMRSILNPFELKMLVAR